MIENNKKMGKDDSYEGCYGEFPNCKVSKCYHEDSCIEASLGKIKNILAMTKSDSNDWRQKDFYRMLEQICKVNKPIFINRNLEKWQEVKKQTGKEIWAIMDNEMVTAANITEQNIIGRYRIDSSNSDGIYELWFDIDCNKNFITDGEIKKQWKYLSKAGNKLMKALVAFGIPPEYIYMKTSGRGLQFSIFTKGFRDDKQYETALQAIQALSGLPVNIKQSPTKGTIWGFDSPAIGSSRRKIRGFGGQNDKLAGMIHYCSMITSLDQKSYPFIKRAKDVVYPQEVKIFLINKDFINKLHEIETFAETADTIQDSGDVVYDRAGELEKLYECPLICKLEEKAKKQHHLTNPERVFLSQIFVFFGKAGEQKLHKIIEPCSDYAEDYTQKQIENVKRCNRKPITCEWAKNFNLCPECKGIEKKTPVALAWKPPKLDELREEILKHVKVRDIDKYVVDFILSTGLERNFNPEGDALWVFIIAVSGSGKTELMRLMNQWKRTYTIDELTKASFISGFKPDEGKFGVLGEFDKRSVYVKDMSQILTSNKDERNAVFGTLRNVYDGYVEKGFGTAKGKIRIDSKFGLFIGMTPIIDAYYSLSNQLGERFLKTRFECDETYVLESIFDQESNAYIEERKRLQRKVNEFLSSLMPHEYEPPTEYKKLILGLMDYTATMRTALFVHTEGDSISFRGSRELPSRTLNQAKKMWNMLASVRQKEKVGKEEIDFVAKSLLQTPPLYRTQTFYHLLKNPNASIHSLAVALNLDDYKAQLLVSEMIYLCIAYEQDGAYSLTPKFQRYGEEYERQGWFQWLTFASSGFEEFRKTVPTKRREHSLDSDWLKDSDV